MCFMPRLPPWTSQGFMLNCFTSLQLTLRSFQNSGAYTETLSLAKADCIGPTASVQDRKPVSAVVLFSACHAHAKSFSCPQRQSLYICGGPDWTVQSAYATQGPFPVISTHTCALRTHGAEKTKRLGAGPCTHFCKVLQNVELVIGAYISI